MNHLKIHAFIPDSDGNQEEEVHTMDEYVEPEKVKKKKQVSRRKKKEIKEEYDHFEGISLNYISTSLMVCFLCCASLYLLH